MRNPHPLGRLATENTSAASPNAIERLFSNAGLACFRFATIFAIATIVLTHAQIASAKIASNVSEATSKSTPGAVKPIKDVSPQKLSHDRRKAATHSKFSNLMPRFLTYGQLIKLPRAKRLAYIASVRRLVVDLANSKSHDRFDFVSANQIESLNRYASLLKLLLHVDSASADDEPGKLDCGKDNFDECQKKIDNKSLLYDNLSEGQDEQTALRKARNKKAPKISPTGSEKIIKNNEVEPDADEMVIDPPADDGAGKTRGIVVSEEGKGDLGAPITEVAANSCETATYQCPTGDKAEVRKQFYSGALDSSLKSGLTNACVFAGTISEYWENKRGPGRCLPPKKFCFSGNCEINGHTMECTKRRDAICNPLLFGVQSSGEPICVDSGKGATSKCQEESAKQDQAADFLASLEPGIKEKWDEEMGAFQQKFTDLCSSQLGVLNCQECTQISQRINTMNKKATGKCAPTDEGNGTVDDPVHPMENVR